MTKKKLMAVLLAGVFATGGLFASQASADTYTIQPEDTLYKISKQFQTSVEEIKELNNLTSNTIFVGDTLKIGGHDEKVYTIAPGDTLFHIALAHDATVDQLQKWNNINSDLIYPGDSITVSGPQQEYAKSEVKSATGGTEAKTTTSAAPDTGRTLTVEATAYTAYCEGCSGTTANGTDLRANPNLKVIAVDPRVIPLGTKVWVEGYGEAVAADTGGAIKGNKIDVFIPDLGNAYEWGRRTVQVKILD